MRTCVVCGDTFSDAEIRGLRKMGETVWLEGEDSCVCPDCMDWLNSLDPAERIRMRSNLRACMQGGIYK